MKKNTVMLLGVEIRHYWPQPQTGRKPSPGSVSAQLRPGMDKLEALLDQMCWDDEVELKAVCGPARTPRLVKMRRDFARAATAKGYSSAMIGAALHRHHTSVLSLLNRV